MGRSIFADYLEHTTRAAMELAEQSDVVELVRIPAPLEGLFLARIHVAYLARRGQEPIGVAAGPLEVMIRIGPDFLRQASPLETVQVGNQNFFHPNYRWPILCVGAVRPGMSLPILLRHVFEIVTYQNYATDDGLDPEACARLRDEPELLDRLPRPPRLIRRPVAVDRAELQTGRALPPIQQRESNRGGAGR